jgi:hypothetical protein
VIASYFARYRTSYDTRTEAVTNLGELRQDVVRRILLPRLYEKWSSEGISLL